MNRLPKGYRLLESLDFVRNRKQMTAVCVLSLVLTAGMTVLGLMMKPISVTWSFMKTHFWTLPVLVGMHFAYILLHELVHGVFMRLFSKQKVRYGFQGCFAYAGSTAFFSVFQHNFVALAPLVIWGIVLFVLERTLPDGWFWMLFSVQIANVSGAAGDLYCVYRALSYPRGTLIQDTGVRMRVFAPHVKEEKV